MRWGLAPASDALAFDESGGLVAVVAGLTAVADALAHAGDPVHGGATDGRQRWRRRSPAIQLLAGLRVSVAIAFYPDAGRMPDGYGGGL